MRVTWQVRFYWGDPLRMSKELSPMFVTRNDHVTAARWRIVGFAWSIYWMLCILNQTSLRLKIQRKDNAYQNYMRSSHWKWFMSLLKISQLPFILFQCSRCPSYQVQQWPDADKIQQFSTPPASKHWNNSDIISGCYVWYSLGEVWSVHCRLPLVLT